MLHMWWYFHCWLTLVLFFQPPQKKQPKQQDPQLFWKLHLRRQCLQPSNNLRMNIGRGVRSLSLHRHRHRWNCPSFGLNRGVAMSTQKCTKGGAWLICAQRSSYMEYFRYADSSQKKIPLSQWVEIPRTFYGLRPPSNWAGHHWFAR